MSYAIHPDGVSLSGREWPNFTCLLGMLFLFQTVSIAVSVLTLCAISVERWYAICHPLQFRSTIQRARFIILAVWFISICIAVPEAASAVVIYQSNDTVIGAYCYPGLMTDKQIQTFQIVLMVVFYFVPLALMGYTYSSIAIVLSKKHIPGITYSGKSIH